MLPRKNRLKRTDEIASVFRRGKAFHSPFFSAKYLFKKGQNEPKIAFSFGKKHLAKAVERNRLKRLIIGNLQKIPDFFLSGVDVVFFLVQPPSVKQKKELEKSVESFVKSVYNRGKLEN